LGENLVLGFVKKKKGECFSIEEGKPKREIIRGDDSVLALISINYL
jgi:hypothetical protein